MKLTTVAAMAFALPLSLSMLSCDKDDALSAEVSAESGEEPKEDAKPPRKVLPPVGVCAVISLDEVTAITGQAYDGALSGAAYPDLAHCEYQQQRYKVSLLIESGKGVTARMEAIVRDQAEAIDGFEDEAWWEPYRGVLTVLSGGIGVEVKISPNHGEVAARLDQSKTLVALLLSRSPLIPEDEAPATPEVEEPLTPEVKE